jgi:hypothetical protein
VCGVGVRIKIWWPLLSAESIDTATARNAGADTVAGVSLPPAWIENVAGTRALTEPPPEDPPPPEGEAPPVGRVVPAGELKEPELAVEPADAVAEVVEVFAAVVLDVEVVAVAGPVLEVLEPPHAASATDRTGSRARSSRR